MTMVSVIVPVYNAEAALERNVNSILNQEYRDLELILVDDGSKDDSPAICDAFAAADPRVHVIHKPNGGVSAARNDGLKAAAGTYIQFLDADDWIPEDSTKLLVRTAEEKDADLVVGEFYRVVGENISRKGSIESDRVLNRREYAEFMKLSPADYYYGVIWNKLYRRSIIEEYDIQMDPDVSFCEDFIFNLEYVLHCERIAPLLAPVYYYVKTEGSLVAQSLTPRRVFDMKTSVYQYYDSFFRNVLDEKSYRRERIGIASFLVSGATDEFVIPMSRSTKKIEDLNISVDEDRSDLLTMGSRYLLNLYAGYLETAGMKNDLSRNEALVFSAIYELKEVHSMKEISWLTALSETTVMAALQGLAAKKCIHVSFMPLSVTVKTDGGAAMIHELQLAKKDVRAVCMEGLADGEVTQFEETLKKVYLNLEKRLGVDS